LALEFTTFGKEPDFTFGIKETDIVSMDKDTSNVTGVQEGETTVMDHTLTNTSI